MKNKNFKVLDNKINTAAHPTGIEYALDNKYYALIQPYKKREFKVAFTKGNFKNGCKFDLPADNFEQLQKSRLENSSLIRLSVDHAQNHCYISIYDRHTGFISAAKIELTDGMHHFISELEKAPVEDVPRQEFRIIPYGTQQVWHLYSNKNGTPEYAQIAEQAGHSMQYPSWIKDPQKPSCKFNCRKGRRKCAPPRP